MMLVNVKVLWSGEARPRVQGGLPGGGDARAEAGVGSTALVASSRDRERYVSVRDWQPAVGREREEGSVLGQEVRRVWASKKLGLCPWAAGRPGKILNRRSSIRAALWRTPGHCTEGLEEEAMVGSQANDDGGLSR